MSPFSHRVSSPPLPASPSRQGLFSALAALKMLIVALALCLGFAGRSMAADTTLESGTTLNSANFTWTNNRPFRVYRITTPANSNKRYTFTLNTTGFAGTITVYQGSFDPTQPNANYWTTGGTASGPGTLTYPVDLTTYASSFDIVVSATSGSADGSYSLSVAGPATVGVNRLNASSDFNFVNSPTDKTIVAGSSTELYAYLTGPLPQTFQWYEGTAPDQTKPIVGATAHRLTVSPPVSTKYWLKVRGADGTFKTSRTATITVSNSTTVTYSGEFSANDRTLSNGDYYDLIYFRVTTAGYYTFGVTKGNLTLYQGSFDPLNPNVNKWGALNSDLPLGDFVLVVSSNSVGAYSGTINGPQPVTLLPPPSLYIVSSPFDQAIAPGASATLTVATAGGSGPSYQWYEGDSGDTSKPIGGATGISYTTPSLNATTRYWVRVTAGTKSVDSSAATIYVLTPPVTYSDQLVSIDPTFNRPQSSGSNLSLSGQNTYYKVFKFKVSTAGNYTFSLNTPNFQGAFALYQGVFIPSEPIVNLYDLSPTSGNPVSKTINLSASSQFYYLVVTSRDAGATGPFTLTVGNGPALIVPDFAPIISTQPTDQLVTADDSSGASATLSVATSNATSSYQWYQGSSFTNRTPIAGATSRTFVTPLLDLDSSTVYSVRLTNTGGYTDSRFATITVKRRPKFVVTTLQDNATADNFTSLREAIISANGSGGGGLITFDPSLQGSIVLNLALPNLNSQISILQTSTNPIVIDGHKAFTIFTIRGGPVEISNLSLINGQGSAGTGEAGAIEMTGGVLTMRNVTLNDNVAGSSSSQTIRAGAGGLSLKGGTATLLNCTFNNNWGAKYTSSETTGIGNTGGGGGAQVSSGSLILINCTLTENKGGAGSAGNQGGNGGAGGVQRIGASGSLTLGNTLIARNSGGDPGPAVSVKGSRGAMDLAGSFTSRGNNLVAISTGASGFLATDLRDGTASPLDIAGLRDNGGPVKTLALRGTTKGLDAGSTQLASDYGLNTDARGTIYKRKSGTSVDIGAFEFQYNQAPIATNVNVTSPVGQPISTQLTATDSDGDTLAYRIKTGTLPAGLSLSASGLLSGTPTTMGSTSVTFVAKDDFVDSNAAALTISITETPSLVVNTVSDASTPYDGLTSLREAVAYANIGRNSIPSIISFDATVFAAPRKTITLTGTQLNVWSSITIQEPAAGLTLDAGGLSRHFDVLEYTLKLSNLNLVNGQSDLGGSIVVNQDGILELSNCTLSGSSATNEGGALYVLGSATLNNCTLSGNHATNGGAIHNLAHLVINSSTIAGNTAAGNGGGILSRESDFAGPPYLEMNNSIVAGNTAGDGIGEIAGTVNSGDYNLLQYNGSPALPGTHNIVGVDAKLGELAENGGLTPTRALLSGSPAINKGSSDLTTDQRGQARPQGSAADIGAYESDGIKPTLVINTPSQGQILTASTLESLTGSATDNVGVTRVQIKLFRVRNGITEFWGGTRFTTTQVLLNAELTAPGETSTNWTYTVSPRLKTALNPGNYEFFAYANDAAGNTTAAVKRSFTIQDTTKPTLVINTPTADQVIAKAALTSLTGTATDDGAVDQVKIKLFRVRGGVTQYWSGSSFGTTPVLLNATVASPGSASTTWSYAISSALRGALDAGDYEFFAYAIDTAGNTTAAVKRDFTISSDDTAPTASISSPTQNQTVDLSELTTLTGSASDNIGVTGVQIKFFRVRGGVTQFWNGESFGSTSVKLDAMVDSPGSPNTTWSYTLSPAMKSAMDNGAFQFFVYASDAPGNTCPAVSRTFTVTGSLDGSPSAIYSPSASAPSASAPSS